MSACPTVHEPLGGFIYADSKFAESGGTQGARSFQLVVPGLPSLASSRVRSFLIAPTPPPRCIPSALSSRTSPLSRSQPGQNQPPRAGCLDSWSAFFG